ncbi:MAG TPA: TolC family protein [Candidatus Acidoferrales bacterium]|nr:TolC family protein [Candidatus Acidoferrales bacterium]
MTQQRYIRLVAIIYLVASLATGTPVFAQAPGPQAARSQAQAAPQQTPPSNYPSLLLNRDYSKGKSALPNIFAPYSGEFVPHPDLTNSSTIYNLIHDRKLELSLPDAIALALQNDLNIGVSEYTPWIAETNILNAEGGGTPLGSFVIGGGGGGSFDPVISVRSSISDISQTINNPLTSGVGTSAQNLTQTSHNTQINLSYTQEFHSGTLFNVQLDNTRSSSSPSANFFNPAVTSDLIVELQQPLLNGWGFLPHTRFILEAKNNSKIGQLQFEETVISEVTQIETQYWILVADRQQIAVAKEALAAYQQLYEADQRLLKIGEIAPSDEVLAESFIAQGNQVLLGAQSAEAVQAAVVLGFLTKDPSDPRFKGVELVPTTFPEDAPQVPDISLDDAVKEAWANRPELKVDQLTLRNDSYDIRATKNALLPSLTLSAEYASVGLSGNTAGAFIPNGTFAPAITEPIVDQNGNPVTSNGIPIFLGVPNGTFGPAAASGIGSAYSQIFHNTSPEYAASLNLNLPLRNRTAQAANAQDQLTEREHQMANQRNRNTIFSGVKEALAAVNIDAAQVQAAVKATQLYQRAYDYSVKSFNLGQYGTNGTFYVTQEASLLNGAKVAELQAKTTYEIALADFNQALGRTLSANNITIAGDGHRDMDLFGPEPLIPGTINGRLIGNSFVGDETR